MIAESNQAFSALAALVCCFMAFAIALNFHVNFLHALGRGIYGSLSLLIGFVTFGKVKIAPLAYRTRARQRRKIREMRMQLEDWRWRRNHQDSKTSEVGGWVVAEIEEDDLVIPGENISLPEPPPGAVPAVDATKPETFSVDAHGFMKLPNPGSKSDQPPSFD